MKPRLIVSAFVLFSTLLSNHIAIAQSYSYDTLNHPDAIETYLTGLNDLGQIVGLYVNADDAFLPFVYEAGEFRNVEFPNVPEADISAINDAGAMTGVGFDEENFSFLAYQSDSEGDAEIFDVPGGFFSFPYSIDESNVVTGIAFGFDDETIFRKDGDNIEQIMLEGFGELSFAAANDSGTIIGVGSLDGDTSVSFIYRDGVAEAFAHPDGETELTAINNSDAISGQVIVDDNRSRSFVFSDSIFTEIGFPGAESTTVSGINDAGVLVGYYRLPNSDGLQGFVATPVPEPANLPMVGVIGLCGALSRSRQMRTLRLAKGFPRSSLV